MGTRDCNTFLPQNQNKLSRLRGNINNTSKSPHPNRVIFYFSHHYVINDVNAIGTADTKGILAEGDAIAIHDIQATDPGSSATFLLAY